MESSITLTPITDKVSDIISTSDFSQSLGYHMGLNCNELKHNIATKAIIGMINVLGITIINTLSTFSVETDETLAH